jgi:hypothetical protein
LENLFIILQTYRASGKRMAKRKSKVKLEPTMTTATAAKASATVGRGRRGRDSVTRVGYDVGIKPIKVVDTHGRQWNRYSP